MHARDADNSWTRPPEEIVDGAAVAKIGDGGGVSAHVKGRRDVFESQWFDSKKRTESEPIVSRNGTQQQNVHARAREAIIRSLADQASWSDCGIVSDLRATARVRRVRHCHRGRAL